MKKIKNFISGCNIYSIPILFLAVSIFAASFKFSEFLGIGNKDKSVVSWFFLGLFQKLIGLIFFSLAIVFFLSIKNKKQHPKVRGNEERTSIIRQIDMLIKGINPERIENAKNCLRKIGNDVSYDDLEAHYLVSKESFDEVIKILEVAKKYNRSMDFKTAVGISLSGGTSKSVEDKLTKLNK